MSYALAGMVMLEGLNLGLNKTSEENALVPSFPKRKAPKMADYWKIQKYFDVIHLRTFSLELCGTFISSYI